LRYPKAWPGSPEWIEQERLFDLIGICHQCHANIHPVPFLFPEDEMINTQAA
jgi:hypothetical protein